MLKLSKVALNQQDIKAKIKDLVGDVASIQKCLNIRNEYEEFSCPL